MTGYISWNKSDLELAKYSLLNSLFGDHEQNHFRVAEQAEVFSYYAKDYDSFRR
jgi:hypothetical protein